MKIEKKFLSFVILMLLLGKMMKEELRMEGQS